MYMDKEIFIATVWWCFTITTGFMIIFWIVGINALGITAMVKHFSGDYDPHTHEHTHTE